MRKVGGKGALYESQYIQNDAISSVAETLIVALQLHVTHDTQGYFKVLGKGKLPPVPIVVRAKIFSKLAERKIREAGGACLLSLP